MSKEQPGAPSPLNKPKTSVSAVEDQIHHATAVESTKRAFEGMHDYRSNLRVLGFEFSREGAKGLLAFVRENPIETFSQYFARVSSTNENLKTKIQHDIALHPGVVAELEAIIERMNESETEADVFHAYEDLKKFFGD